MRHRFQAFTIAFTTALLIAAGMSVAVPDAQAGSAPSTKVLSIGDQVHRKLTGLPWYGVFDILQYQVNGSEVILSGQVVSEHDVTKYDAENLVRQIPGVTRVVNRIEVLPLSSFDNQIRRGEYRTIFSQGDLGRYTLGAIPQVHIIVKNGHVFLEGDVMDQMDKTMAGMAANSVPKVFSVTNNLRID